MTREESSRIESGSKDMDSAFQELMLEFPEAHFPEFLERPYDEEVVRRARENPCGVLHIENDEDELGEWADFYRQPRDFYGETGAPVKYFRATNAQAATSALKAHWDEIHLILVDIVLGRAVMAGDEWLLDNRARLEGSGKIILVYSGNVGRVHDAKRLAKFVSGVFVKGSEDDNRIMQLPIHLAYRMATEEMAKQVLPPRTRGQEDTKEIPSDQVLFSKLRDRLVVSFSRFIGQFPDQNNKRWIQGVKVLSLSEVLQEVESGSKLGDQLLDLYLEDLEDR